MSAQSCPTLWSHGLYPIRLLCLWDSPGKNTGVGCHALLQGIFPTQGLNSGLQYCRQFSHSVVSKSLQPHGLAACQASLSITNSWGLFKLKSNKSWCHPTISSSVVLFFCLQSFPASGSFPMSQFFASGDQSIGVSALAAVLPINIEDRFPLAWTGLISLLSKGLSRVFSNTTVQKHQFLSAQRSL